MQNYNTNTDVNESTFEDLRALNEITTPEQIYQFLGDIIILNRYKTNFYEYLYTRVIDVAAMCWGNRDEERDDVLQHTLIHFKVDVDDTVTHALPLNRFMISLAFIRAIIEYIDVVNIDDFILHDYMTAKSRGIIQDNIVATLLDHGHQIPEVQERLATMALDIKEQLLIFAHADIQIFTAENLFLDYYKESKIIRDINNTEYPSSMQTADIVEENKARYEKLEKEMIRLGNPFFLDNRFTGIIKPKQMEELYINFSQIPDGKDIVPVIMNGNGFKAGYHDLPVFYAGSIAARVPDIMNDRYMGSSGYFARNLMILTYGTLSKTVYDCGSKNPIPITVDDTALDMMQGRYYYTQRNDGRMRMLRKTDKHLIGKTLWFRSPCTCNLNEDVCHVCYGSAAIKVGELKGGFIYTTNLMTSRISQNILSAKHLLKTNAERFVCSDSFSKFFVVDSSTVIPNDEQKKFDIYIPEDYQDDLVESFTFYVTKDMIPITISNYASIYVPDNVIDECKDVTIDDKIYHKITSHKVLELGGTLCVITPINLAMTQKYSNIMNLFESEIARYEKIEDVVTKLMHLLSGLIPVLSVHGEVILRGLIRDVNNKLLRPDWTQDNPEYVLNRVKTALQNVESFSTALAFEKTRHHVVDRIFDERNTINRVGPAGFTDFLFGQETI